MFLCLLLFLFLAHSPNPPTLLPYFYLRRFVYIHESCPFLGLRLLERTVSRLAAHLFFAFHCHPEDTRLRAHSLLEWGEGRGRKHHTSQDLKMLPSHNGPISQTDKWHAWAISWPWSPCKVICLLMLRSGRVVLPLGLITAHLGLTLVLVPCASSLG